MSNIEEKINPYEIPFERLVEVVRLDTVRFTRCWNILRTCTDEQLTSLEKQVDATIEEVGEEFVGVFIGPTLPF